MTQDITTASGAADALRAAITRAFNLGQTYLQQADSDSYAEQGESRSTYKKYKALLEETCTTLAASAPAPQPAAPSAMQMLTAALKADSEYAWSWHCNLAMPIMDHAQVSHRVANIAAARLMQHLFGIDTEQHSHFKVDEAPAPPQQGEYLPLPECDATTIGLGQVWNRHSMHAYVDADRAARGAAQAAHAPVTDGAVKALHDAMADCRKNGITIDASVMDFFCNRLIKEHALYRKQRAKGMHVVDVD